MEESTNDVNRESKMYTMDCLVEQLLNCEESWIVDAMKCVIRPEG